MSPRNLPDDITYERWVRYIFDHPVLPLAWWWHDEDSEHYESWIDAESNPDLTLEFLTRLFLEPDELLENYTTAQIDQGLNLLASTSCGDFFCCLLDTTIPWEKRRACIDAMVPLYERLMAPVYDQPGEKRYAACGMWWDIILLHGGMDHVDRERINDAVIGVFDTMATTRSMACLESVLHGLGHWHLYVPERTVPIVDRILARKDLTDELREYAEDARVGMVQ